MTPLRVAFVCQWFRPEPVSQPGSIVNGLLRAGAAVEVLTGIPNYPSGRVTPGYRAWRVSSELLDGVMVHRTPLYPSHNSSALRRMLNYLSWALSSALWGQAHLGSADVALVYSSPATAALPAMGARRRNGLPYVLLVQDVWPDSIYSSGFLTGHGGRLASYIVDAFANRAYRNAEHIAVISPGMADLLESRGVPREKISVIYNWTQDTGSDNCDGPDLRRVLGIPQDDFVLMYAGNHGAAQGLDAIVRAFSEIPETEHCHLVLVGDGVEKARLRVLASTLCPGSIHFVAAQPRHVMADVMSQADVQLVSLRDQPLFRVTMPSKLQSILSAGHAVLVSASGDAATVVKEARAGIAVQANDPAEVADAVVRLRQLTAAERHTLGANGRAYYREHMAEGVGASRLFRVLETAARSSARDRTTEEGTHLR